jgi:hypothetical protein
VTALGLLSLGEPPRLSCWTKATGTSPVGSCHSRSGVNPNKPAGVEPRAADSPNSRNDYDPTPATVTKTGRGNDHRSTLTPTHRDTRVTDSPDDSIGRELPAGREA